MIDDKQIKVHPLVWFVPITMLLMALFPLPYAYYQILRVVVCAAMVFLVCHEEWSIHKISIILIAILFNPVFPIHLTREAWMVFNILVSIYLALHWAEHKTKP